MPKISLAIACTLALLGSAPAYCDKPSEERAPKPIAGNSSTKVLVLPEITTQSLLAQKAAQYTREPNKEDLFYPAVQYYMKNGMAAKGQSLIQEALKNHPDWAAPNVILGRIAQQGLEDDDAVKYFELALKSEPNCLNALDSYSSALGQSGRHKECVATANRALKVLNANSKELGEALLLQYRTNFLRVKYENLVALQDRKGAISTMEESLKLYPKNLMTMIDLCKSYLLEGQYKKALDLSNKLDSWTPRCKDACLFRAQAYKGLNQNESALKDINTYLKGISAVEIYKPVNIEARKLRADLYEATGRKKEASAERAALKSAIGTVYQITPFRSGIPK